MSSEADVSTQAWLTTTSTVAKDDCQVTWTRRTPWHRLMLHVSKAFWPPLTAQPSPTSATTIPWDVASLRHALVGDFSRLLTPPVAPKPWAPAIPESDLVAARIRQREALSIEPETLVIAALGNTPNARDCDAFRAVYAFSLARTSGIEFVTLMPRAARQLRRAARFHKRTSPDARLLVLDDIANALPAIDLALWVGPGFGPMHTPPVTPAIAADAIIHAWRHEVPVIAPRWALGFWLPPNAPINATLTSDATLPELIATLLATAHPDVLPAHRTHARNFCDLHALPYADWHARALHGQGPGPYDQSSPSAALLAGSVPALRGWGSGGQLPAQGKTHS